jgi:hypothetical protein
MTIHDTATQVLPEQVRQQVLGVVTQMWQAVAQGELTPAQAEERVIELSRELGREVLAAGWEERYGRQQGPARSCACGQAQQLEGYRRKWVVTALGAARYRRAYYRCGQCGRSYHAGDRELGLEGGSYTLVAQELTCLVDSELPYARSCALLQRLTGLGVAPSHAERITERWGGQVEAQQEQEREALFAGELEYLPPTAPPERLYIELDGTQTLFLDSWHESKVGAVYEGEPDAQGQDEAVRTSYVSGVREECEAFGKRLYQEARRRGVEQAREVITLADGAPWIWNLVAEHFPQAVQILDFYHASERLYEVGKAVYGETAAEGKRWAEANRGRLRRGQVGAMLRSLQALQPRTEEGREAVRLALGYFESNRSRMRYAQYRARGYQIGSGVVEASCKQVVGARCKGAGMRWTKAGAQHVLALRCLLLSNRWDDHWRPLKAAA